MTTTEAIEILKNLGIKEGETTHIKNIVGKEFLVKIVNFTPSGWVRVSYYNPHLKSWGESKLISPTELLRYQGYTNPLYKEVEKRIL